MTPENDLLITPSPKADPIGDHRSDEDCPDSVRRDDGRAIAEPNRTSGLSWDRSLGPGNARRMKTPRLSAEAMAERTPRPPEEFVDALHDRIHPASGRLLASKPVLIQQDR